MKEVFALKKIKRPAREQYKLNLEIPEYTCFLGLKFGYSPVPDKVLWKFKIVLRSY